jgi:hypothetical protein
MATLISKRQVCDVGLEKCDSSTLHRVKLSIDGKVSEQLLCVKHAAPFERLKAKMGPEARGKRGKVYTTREIAARKRATSKP